LQISCCSGGTDFIHGFHPQIDVKMKTLRFLLLLALLPFIPAGAQDTIRFREGLAVARCQQYGRQALFTDQLAARMFSADYQRPKKGAVLFTDDQGREVSWQPIEADSSGKFSGRAASMGYIYLTWKSSRERGGIINISGDMMFYWNGESHPGDPYQHGYLNIPVRIRKGLNEMYIRTSWMMRQGMPVTLVLPKEDVLLMTDDPTLPHIVPGRDNTSLLGALVLINTSSKPLRGLTIRSLVGGRELSEPVPDILPYASRKIPFRFDGSTVTGKGEHPCELTLLSKGKEITHTTLPVESMEAGVPYKCTFISDIDGSVQYYAVNPQIQPAAGSALFLSVHGAGVEAIGQARAYHPKDWGTLVAPTNRRPRGFNWEDWGRIDALEVLDIARKEYQPDPAKIYLTGHSMGGHGTWYLGATYPDKWAAIAPCSGYASLMAYASADGKIPEPGDNVNEQNLYRASDGSNVPELVHNYRMHGVYVLHGDADRTVPVEYARQMRGLLGQFHPDFAYYEYPGGGHWWSNESVDWPPMFDFLKFHVIRPDSVVNRIEFRTANPAVSSSCRWVSVLQQAEPLKYSTVEIDRDRGKGSFSAKTENISVLGIDAAGISTGNLQLTIDGDQLTVARPAGGQLLVLVKKDHWALGKAPGVDEKGPVRNGTFKEAFNHRMIFVYGTAGTREENDWALAKAKYDAETWLYRGNGAVDMIPDTEFDPARYPERGVILYGNATTNKAWPLLLAKCPIQVSRGSLVMGSETLTGNGYGTYLMYPRPDSPDISVAAVTGTGLPGMHAADANQYFSGGSGFPDYLIFTADMPKIGAGAIVHAGYYGNRWELVPSTK
jgi:pimeloyl-ACP methyl ester carboxylesterase